MPTPRRDRSQPAPIHGGLDARREAVGVAEEGHVELAREERTALLIDRVDLEAMEAHLLLHLLRRAHSRQSRKRGEPPPYAPPAFRRTGSACGETQTAHARWRTSRRHAKGWLRMRRGGRQPYWWQKERKWGSHSWARRWQHGAAERSLMRSAPGEGDDESEGEGGVERSLMRSAPEGG